MGAEYRGLAAQVIAVAGAGTGRRDSFDAFLSQRTNFCVFSVDEPWGLWYTSDIGLWLFFKPRRKCKWGLISQEQKGCLMEPRRASRQEDLVERCVRSLIGIRRELLEMEPTDERLVEIWKDDALRKVDEIIVGLTSAEPLEREMGVNLEGNLGYINHLVGAIRRAQRPKKRRKGQGT